MWKSLLTTLLVIVSLSLSACTTGLASVQSYTDSADGYQFLYPQGWIAVDVKDASPGVDVVFRDFIERTENLSVIISDVPGDKDLTDLGTPSEVGYRFFKLTEQDQKSDRQVEFINAEKKETEDALYYLLEYQVKLPNNQERHNLASVAIKNNKLYTFNLSTTQNRWNKVEDLFRLVVKSFSVK